ncbi:hypothetical protein [Paraburkholderia sp. D1E]|uniref:hypothetical protein n=1 Tax=Paraburkholderia sp. D1E TaxID=3461398 RepID=UPI0040466862
MTVDVDDEDTRSLPQAAQLPCEPDRNIHDVGRSDRGNPHVDQEALLIIFHAHGYGNNPAAICRRNMGILQIVVCGDQSDKTILGERLCSSITKRFTLIAAREALTAEVISRGPESPAGPGAMKTGSKRTSRATLIDSLTKLMQFLARKHGLFTGATGS